MRSYRKEIDGLEKLIKQAKKDGKVIVVTSNTVEFNRLKIKGKGKIIVSDHYVLGDNKLSVKEITHMTEKTLYAQRRDKQVLNSKIKDITLSHDVIFLNRDDFMCNHLSQKCYGITGNGKKIFFDYGHYTMDGARFFGKKAREIDWLSLMYKELKIKN